MKKYIIVGLIAIVVSGMFIGIKFLKSVNNYKKKVKEIVIEDADLSKIPDGKYYGECNVEFINAKVEVEIEDHKYKNINLLKHDNGRGSAAEIIPNKVVQAQSLEVDTVSGATNSSIVILGAISNALK